MDLTSLNEISLQWTGLSPQELIPWAFGSALALVTLVLAWWASSAPFNDSETDASDAQTGIFGSATSVLARVIPDLLPYKARRDLLRCGFLQPGAYESYLALRNALVIGMTLTAGVWLVAVADNDLLAVQALIVGALALILVYSLPRLYLNWRGDRYADQTVLGLPDALDAIVMGISGGLPLQTALHRAGGQLANAHPLLAEQLQIVRRQAAAGTLEQALDRWAERIDLEEVATLASLVSHAERTGSSVSGVLRDYADSLRLKRRQRAQERSNRVAIQMLFPTVLCLAPATYIILLAPPLLDLQRFRDRENESGGLLSPPSKIGGQPAARRPN